MGSQKISCDALENMNLKSQSEKIKRPPNAFMLYARDNRKRVAAEHPEINNKVVSSILGKMWKNTPANIKKGYFNKAKEVGELHKIRYPGYVYCPRTARLQKMQKKKMKDRYNASTFKQESDENTEAVKQIIKQENNLNEEDPSYEAVAIPEYVPNNPGYCIGPNPESFHVKDEQDSDSQMKITDAMAYPEASGVEDEDGCNLQIDADDETSMPKLKFESQMMPEGRCCSEPSMYYIPPDKAQETQSYLSKNPQYWQATYRIPEIPPYFPENMRNSEVTSRITEDPSYYFSNPQYSQATSRIKEEPSYYLSNPQYSQATSRIKEVPCCFLDNPQYSQATSLIREEIPPYFLENSHYSKAASRMTEIPSNLPENSPSFSRDDVEHFPGSIRYFYHAPPNDYYQEPNTYSPPYYSYWNSHTTSCYRRQNDSCENSKPFSYVKSYCPSELCNPAVRYFNRSFMPYYKDSSYAFYPHLNADMKRSQVYENLVPLQNPETDVSSFHISEKEGLSASHKENYDSEFNSLKHNNELSSRENSSTSSQVTSNSEINSSSIDNELPSCEFHRPFL